MFDKRYLTLSIFSETLSYTKTAKRLFITQPAVSQQLKSLENELGFSIIEKENHTLNLTKEGEELVRYINYTNIETQKVLKRLKDKRQKPTLNIGSTLSLSRTLLPQFLQIFTPYFPEIQTKVANTEEVLAQIKKGTIDCGFVEGNFNREEFDAIFIKRDAFVAVTNNSQILPKKGRIPVEKLLKEKLLVREKGSGSLAILENWLGTENITLRDFTEKIEIPNPSTIIQVLKTGLGFSFLYQSLVVDELNKGELHIIPLQDLSITHPIHFVYLKNSYFKDEYRLLAKKLKEEKE